MKAVIRTLDELGHDIVLSPERFLVHEHGDDGQSVPLSELVVERRERAPLGEGTLVLDTTHARDGLLDIPAARRAAPSTKSAKKTASVGDLVVSRLRPYLRQIALVHPRALEASQRAVLAFSTEFYVLAPRNPREDLAFLVPVLLSSRIQAILAGAQEGGHHPRVPLAVVLGLRIPKRMLGERARRCREVRDRLDDLYKAEGAYHALLDPG